MISIGLELEDPALLVSVSPWVLPLPTASRRFARCRA